MLNWRLKERKYEDPWWRQLTIDHVQRADRAPVWTGCSCGSPNSNCEEVRNHDGVVRGVSTLSYSMLFNARGCQLVKFRKESHEELARRPTADTRHLSSSRRTHKARVVALISSQTRSHLSVSAGHTHSRRLLCRGGCGCGTSNRHTHDAPQKAE